MEDSELKKLAVSQYQLKKYHNFISDKLGTTETSADSEKESIVNLYLYESSGGSFTYDSSVEYQYNDSMTVKREYADTSDDTDYAIFKVFDVDLYLVFTIGDDGETYTYSVSYSAEELPSEMAELFEVGSYAVVHRLSATKSDIFYPNKVSVFVESDGTPIFDFIRYVDDGSGLVGSEGTYIIILSLDKTKVYVYRYSDSRGWYRYSAGYKEGNGTVAVQTTFKDLRALVCCNGSFNADTNYPDGTIGAAIKGAGKIAIIKTSDGNTLGIDSSDKSVTLPESVVYTAGAGINISENNEISSIYGRYTSGTLNKSNGTWSIGTMPSVPTIYEELNVVNGELLKLDLSSLTKSDVEIVILIGQMYGSVEFIIPSSFYTIGNTSLSDGKYYAISVLEGVINVSVISVQS